MNRKEMLFRLRNKLRKLRLINILYQLWYENLCDRKSCRQLDLVFFGEPRNLKEKWEPNEIDLINEILPNVDCMINVGANIGYYVCFVRNKGIKTIAIEPLSRNLKFLYRNLQINKLAEGVDVYPLALSDHIGIDKIYGRGGLASLIKGWYGQPANQFQSVPVNTLDNLFTNRFAGKRLLIIIDVEGNENKILQAATHHLCMDPKPVWMVEIGFFPYIENMPVQNKNIDSTFAFFYDNGYSAWLIGEKLREITRDNLPEFIRQNKVATSNFLFIDSKLLPPLLKIKM